MPTTRARPSTPIPGPIKRRVLGDNNQHSPTKSVHGPEGSPHSSKSVRWGTIAIFQEQQTLQNLHDMLRNIVDTTNKSRSESRLSTEVIEACEVLLLFLPKPGLAAERKYFLRTAQEQELERSLRVLQTTLKRDIDPPLFRLATSSILKLTPLLQQRFATLPYHREMAKLKTEREQLKLDCVAALTQIAIQEEQIRISRIAREESRKREIEEFTMKRMKRREEKRLEKEALAECRKALERRTEELKELQRRIGLENERIAKAREIRGTKVEVVAGDTVKA